MRVRNWSPAIVTQTVVTPLEARDWIWDSLRKCSKLSLIIWNTVYKDDVAELAGTWCVTAYCIFVLWEKKLLSLCWLIKEQVKASRLFQKCKAGSTVKDVEVAAFSLRSRQLESRMWINVIRKCWKLWRQACDGALSFLAQPEEKKKLVGREAICLENSL